MRQIQDNQKQAELIRQLSFVRRALRRNDRYQGFNKFVVLLCTLPFLHLAGCVGQAKTIPVVSRVGGVGFIASCLVAARLNKRETDLYRKMEQVQRELAKG